MSWAVGEHRGRDIGYGVPAICDHPECNEEIDRGLGYVCGGNVYGGENGCGLFFCGKHLLPTLCDRCLEGGDPFTPTPDTEEWINHKLTDESWGPWRKENPTEVADMQEKRLGSTPENEVPPQYRCDKTQDMFIE